VIIDPSELDPQSVYKLLIGSVVPRPIAWTSTVSAEGARNLAPFSFFTVASRQPPMLCISVGPRVDSNIRTKDTLDNIEATEEFVVNIVSLALSNTMFESSKNRWAPPSRSSKARETMNSQSRPATLCRDTTYGDYSCAVNHLRGRGGASRQPIHAGSWIRVSEKTSSRQLGE
jgi:flavin reductase (DIM6/NTAB) family NADH-FMN oxidoreductase RutF